MKTLTVRKIFLSLVILNTWTSYLYAQDQNVTVNQDSKFEQLLNEKRKINPSLTVNDSYKIQIYNGSSENAKKTLSDFKQNFSDIDATIVFNTPNYKVWVGNYKTRIDAERSLIDIKKKYNNVLLIKPGK
ncbi:MAG: SPOR domain-containing protein [Flavobacterium sp.]|uniref:SPOR domain-containing protein n=1 Tax=Flavobacterium sp. TaxID=239 RepID=UPI00262A2678|nr:SPOR domain-containing protein [Flavobacterium sp.]MDD5152059.1 SPOR domain-containing protein [Flavobacterium sp.]